MLEEEKIKCDLKKVHEYIDAALNLAENMGLNMLEVQLGSESISKSAKMVAGKSFKTIAEKIEMLKEQD